MTPVFMIGTQRSGSNLLRLMLNQLEDIASPHPPHILERMQPLMAFYGSFEIDENYKKLINDVCRLVELNPVEWNGIKLDRDEIASRAKGRSLLGVYAAIHDIYSESQGAKTWCCKAWQILNIYVKLKNISSTLNIFIYIEMAVMLLCLSRKRL